MDKKIKKQVAKLILKKSNAYLKISIAIFLLSLFLVSTSFLFLFKQYIQVDKDFISNENVRMIEITGKTEQNNHARSLKFNDENELEYILSAYKGIHIYKMYQLNFGVEDEEGSTYFIYGVDEEAAHFLGDCQLDVGFACSKLKTSEITLQIPVVQIEDGGMSSYSRANFLVKNKQGILQKNPFTLYTEDQGMFRSHTLYVGNQTFQKIIETSFNTDWMKFKREYDRDNPFGVQILKSMYIYVDNISHIERIAGRLEEYGYQVRYAFKAFDNFTLSIRNTAITASSLSAVIVLIAAAHLIFSFRAYLQVQQKDMGILKQYGYSSENVKSIYAHNIFSVFKKVVAIILVYSIAIGIYFIPFYRFMYIVYVLIILLVVILLVYRIIVKNFLQSYCSKNMIDLLKLSKEFE
ncbi:ABC transporter permease family protein [Anoxybacillus sp. TBDG-1]